MNRRDFLRASVLAGGAAVLPQAARAEAADRPLKVCVFSDLHFTPGVYTNDTPEFLERILARAEKERCDLVIHAGDMVQNVAERPVKELLATYNGFKIPARHVIGNHEQDGTTHEETLEALQLTCGHYFFDMGGFRFVILDPNYFCNEPGQYIHHENGNYFKRVKGSTINWIPPDQLEWLRSVIVCSPYPCVVLSHQSFERPPNGAGVMNKDAVQAIFNEANAKKPGTVRLVMNGHLHMDFLRVLDNILYWDVNSANYQYYDKKHAKYPAESVRALAEEKSLGLVELRRPLAALGRPLSGRETSLLSAALVLQAMGERPLVAKTVIDAVKGKAAPLLDNGSRNVILTAVSGDPTNGVAFTYAPKALPLPATEAYRALDAVYPLTERFNREDLVVTGLAAGSYRVLFDGAEVGAFTAEELAQGVNVALLATPNQKLAQATAGLAEELAALPPKGCPLETADLVERINAVRPLVSRVRVVSTKK